MLLRRIDRKRRDTDVKYVATSLKESTKANDIASNVSTKLKVKTNRGKLVVLSGIGKQSLTATIDEKQIKSLDSGKIYTVRYYKTIDVYTCECLSYKFRGRCKHIEGFKRGLTEVKRIKNKNGHKK